MRFQKLIPHFIIVAIFIAISVIYCYPVLKGEKLLPADTYHWISVSKESRDYFLKTGENAFWTNSLFSGMPTAQLDLHPHNNWYLHLNSFIQGYTHGNPVNPIFFFLISMVSFYLLMLSLRVNKWIGAAAAIAFAFSSYLPIIINAGHGTKMMDIALMPGVFAGVILAYRGKYLQGAALTGLFLALFIASAHFQIIYYAMIVVGVMVVAMGVAAFKNKKVKEFFIASLALALAAGLAAMTSSTSLITANNYNKNSIRGGVSELADKAKGGLDKDYAFSWSNSWGETFCLLVPNLYGGSSSEPVGENSHYADALSEVGAPAQQIEQLTNSAPTYWGDQPFLSGPIYFGAVVIFLFALALLSIRSAHKWWVVGVSVFFILLSLGKNFPALNYFLFDHLPMYNKFRTPSMALSVPLVLFPAMGAWGLYKLMDGTYTGVEIWKKVKLAFMITGGLTVLILISAMMFMDFRSANDAALQEQFGKAGETLLRAIREDRASLAMKDAFRSLVFIALAAGVLWAYAKNHLKATFAVAAIALLIVIDQVPVAKRYLNKDNFIDEYTYEQQFTPRPVDQEILKDKDPFYRVFDLSEQGGPFNSAKPSLFHKMVGGYHPAKLEIYQDLIENQIGKYNIPVLNMLNTKYIITPAQNNQPAMAQPLTSALGNAWFVSNIKWAKTAREAMDDLNGPSLASPTDTTKGNFRPEQTAIVRENYKDKLQNYTFGKDSSAHIKLTKYSPRATEYEANNGQNGLAVFSEIYYPEGWKATIDGKEAEIINVNYVLRALQIPAGKHQIKFEFTLPGYEKGEQLSLIGSILMTLLILAGVFFAFKNKKETDEFGSLNEEVK